MTITHDRVAKRPIRPDQKTIWRIAIVLALGMGSAIAWTTLYSQQSRKIQQATATLDQACAIDLSTRTRSFDAAQQVNAATQQLRSVPTIPGLGHRYAQAELSQAAPCIQRVQSTASLFQAQDLSQAASQITPTTVLSAQEWQGQQASLKQAIATLQSIPVGSSLYPQAQAELKANQTQLATVEARLQNETGAVNAYLRAVGLVQQADELLQTTAIKSTPTVEDLSDAESRVLEAIRLMQSIPAGTTISASQQVTLNDYQAKLAQIQKAWIARQLKPLVDDFLAFSESLDVNLGYEAYFKKWNDLKDHFETQTQDSAVLLNHPVTQTLAIAAQQYDDALNVWRYCHEQNCYNSFQAGFILDSPRILWLPETLEIDNKPLNQTYQVESIYSLVRQERLVQLQSALRQIWKDAEQSLQDAKAQV